MTRPMTGSWSPEEELARLIDGFDAELLAVPDAQTAAWLELIAAWRPELVEQMRRLLAHADAGPPPRSVVPPATARARGPATRLH